MAHALQHDYRVIKISLHKNVLNNQQTWEQESILNFFLLGPITRGALYRLQGHNMVKDLT